MVAVGWRCGGDIDGLGVGVVVVNPSFDFCEKGAGHHAGLKVIKLSDGGEDLPNFLGKCVWRADVVPQLHLTHEAPRGRAKRCAATART